MNDFDRYQIISEKDLYDWVLKEIVGDFVKAIIFNFISFYLVRRLA